LAEQSNRWDGIGESKEMGGEWRRRRDKVAAGVFEIRWSAMRRKSGGAPPQSKTLRVFSGSSLFPQSTSTATAALIMVQGCAGLTDL
jgi:hypothetical protein